MVQHKVQNSTLTTGDISEARCFSFSANLWQQVPACSVTDYYGLIVDYSLLIVVSRGSVLCEGGPDRLFLVW